MLESASNPVPGSLCFVYLKSFLLRFFYDLVTVIAPFSDECARTLAECLLPTQWAPPLSSWSSVAMLHLEKRKLLM
jgi:hypothetical protein